MTAWAIVLAIGLAVSMALAIGLWAALVLAFGWLMAVWELEAPPASTAPRDDGQ